MLLSSSLYTPLWIIRGCSSLSPPGMIGATNQLGTGVTWCTLGQREHTTCARVCVWRSRSAVCLVARWQWSGDSNIRGEKSSRRERTMRKVVVVGPLCFAGRPTGVTALRLHHCCCSVLLVHTTPSAYSYLSFPSIPIPRCACIVHAAPVRGCNHCNDISMPWVSLTTVLQLLVATFGESSVASHLYHLVSCIQHRRGRAEIRKVDWRSAAAVWSSHHHISRACRHVRAACGRSFCNFVVCRFNFTPTYLSRAD